MKTNRNENEKYIGWIICGVGDDDSLLLQSPMGNRRRVYFRERIIETLITTNKKIGQQALRYESAIRRGGFSIGPCSKCGEDVVYLETDLPILCKACAEEAGA